MVRGQRREECTGRLNMVLRWDVMEGGYGVDPETLLLKLCLPLTTLCSVDLVRTLERSFAGQDRG